MKNSLIHLLIVSVLGLALCVVSPRTADAAACGASTALFRSAATGNWSVNATWQTSTNGGTTWVAATCYPTSASGAITIQSPHNVTVDTSLTADEVTINSGGMVTVGAGQTWAIANGAGTDLTVNGTVVNSGTITMNGSAAFNSGSTYQHAENGGTIPTATWNVASIVLVTGVVGTRPGGTNQTFGNLTWNCPSQTTIMRPSNTWTISGTLTIQNTGTGQFRMGNGTNTVSGNYVQNGGTVRIASNTARTLTVGGDFSLTGGTFILTSASSPGTLNVAGNFTHSSGTLTETDTGTIGHGDIIFNGTGIQTYTSGGTLGTSAVINYIVNSGATLLTGTSLVGDGSVGFFTLSSGATLGIGDGAGITASGATGNVRLTGNRTYNAAASYIYNGVANQVTGNGLPATVNNLTISNTGSASNSTVTLSNAVTVTGNLTLTSGTLSTSASNYNIVVKGNWVNNGGTYSPGTSAVTFNGTAAQSIGGTTSTIFGKVVITNTADTCLVPAVTINTNTIINNSLTLSSSLQTNSTAVLDMTGATSTSGVVGDVLGNVKRTDVGATGRVFGNPSTMLTLTTGSASAITVTLVKPIPMNAGFSSAVNRLYSINVANPTSFSATLLLHYRDDGACNELGTNNENLLQVWQYQSGAWQDQSYTARDPINNLISKAGLTSLSTFALSATNQQPVTPIIVASMEGFSGGPDLTTRVVTGILGITFFSGVVRMTRRKRKR